MTGKTYGYARVSTREQNEDRQMIALTEAGVDASNIFIDKQSGKDFDRPEYLRLMRRMKRGDEDVSGKSRTRAGAEGEVTGTQ